MSRGRVWVAPLDVHEFNSAVGDGYSPEAAVTIDQSGNLYGTAAYGGASGRGAVYKIIPVAGGGWNESLVYSFANTTDGEYPFSKLIIDNAGNLYGTPAGSGDNQGQV